MNGLFDFMASVNGRAARIVAGIALIAIGLLAVGGIAGLIIAIIGVLPLAAGVLDSCVFAPLFGFPLSGPAIRRLVHR